MGIVEEVIDFSAAPSEGSLGVTVSRTPIGIALICIKHTCLRRVLDKIDPFKNADRQVERLLLATGNDCLMV